jgi:hypothetical protein
MKKRQLTFLEAYKILKVILENWDELSHHSKPGGYWCCTDHCHAEYNDGEELLIWLKSKIE